MLSINRSREDEETSYWLSYSDMMAALLLTFVLIISFTMLQSKKQYDEKEQELVEQQALVEEQKKVMEAQQEQLDKIVGIREDIIEALKTEFDGTNLSLSVDQQTGSIIFDSNVLFDYNKFDLKKSGQSFLQQFLPRYFNVLLGNDFKDYVSEVIIEGHTDTQGDYLLNLALSQKRALAVASFCLQKDTKILNNNEVEILRNIVTANGKSFSNPIYSKNGSVDMNASRRVEFKFRLKDEEMIDKMISILDKYKK